MKQKLIFAAVFLLLWCFSLVSVASAQQTKQQTEASYEMVLQVLTASDSPAAGEKQNVPKSLAVAVGKLKNTYSFSNYRLSETYFQRVANSGSATSNGVSNQANQNAFAPVFSEWAIDQFSILPDASGQDSASLRNFRFGQRVPVKTTLAAPGAEANAVINYQQVGITVSRLNMPVGEPIIVGNLSASKTGELSFLILTVRRAEN
jgi:hypothetical protein